jgi:hypothetical protein
LLWWPTKQPIATQHSPAAIQQLALVAKDKKRRLGYFYSFTDIKLTDTGHNRKAKAKVGEGEREVRWCIASCER